MKFIAIIMGEELWKVLVREESKHLRRAGRELFADDIHKRQRALIETLMVREALLPLLAAMGTESASMLFLELRFLDPVYLQRVAHRLMLHDQTRGVADTMSRYASLLPLILSCANENSPPPRVRNFTNDAVSSLAAQPREYEDICLKLIDIQETLQKLQETLQKRIRPKKQRAQAVIDLLSARSALEDLCATMFMEGYFVYAEEESPIHRNIRASRADIDDQGNMVIEIMDDGISPRAYASVERLQHLSKSMEAYLNNY